MALKIRIALEHAEVTATLDDSAAAQTVAAALPLGGVVSTWGHEDVLQAA